MIDERRGSLRPCRFRRTTSRPRRTALSAAFAALAAVTGQADVPGPPEPSPTPAIETTLRGIFAGAGVRAAGWCAVRDGQVVAMDGLGFADPKEQRPVDAESTVFRAASVGKVFVALAALLAEADGRLDLHADVNSILKDVRIPATFPEPVTLDHLLTHTGGFEGRFLGGLAPSPESVVPLNAYLAMRMPARVFPPGLWLAYSNHGMALAGLAVQEATGQRFDDFADTRVFRPLGMDHTTFRQPPPPPIRDALVSDPRGEGPWLNPYPAGSLVTSVADMGRFLRAVLGGAGAGEDGAPLIAPEVRARLLARHFGAHPEMPGVAYGLFEGVANGHRTLHHTGDGGQHSLLWLMPDQNAGLFVVYTTPETGAGSPAGPRERAAKAVADWLVPAKPFKLPSPHAGSDAAVRAHRYAGLYRPTHLAVTTIEKLAALPGQVRVADRPDGTLEARLGLGGEREVFVETSPLLFRSADGSSLAFSQDAGGRILGLTGTSGGVDDPLSAVRVRWFDDSRLHLGLMAATLLLVLARLLAMIGGLIARVLRPRSLPGAAPTSGRTPDGWGWRASGLFALLCVAAPLVGVASIVAAGGPIYRVPIGVYAGLALLGLAALVGILMVPLAVRAWTRREGSRWNRVLLTALALAGLGTAPFLHYWKVLAV